VSVAPAARGPQVELAAPRVKSNPWVILLVLTLGFFMILLDTTIVNIAVPRIEKDLNTSFDEILWILNAYILVYAVLLIVAGRLGDIFGPRRLFIIGLVIFTISSALCGIAQSPGELILFRIAQGVGGATLTPQTLSVITSIFPPERRGAAFGVWGAVAGVAAVVGPTLGGFLVTSAGWQSIFFVNVPIGVIAVVAAFLLLPEIRSHRSHDLDLPGVFMASSSLFLGVFALIEGQRFDWGPINTWGAFGMLGMRLAPISIYSLLLYTAILMVLFVAWERRTSEPVLPMSLFRNYNYSIANAASAAVSYGMLSIFLPLTIFLQSVLLFSALHAGVTFIPMSAASLVTAPFAGRLTDRINGKYVLMVGAGLFALGIGLIIATMSLDSTSWTLAIPMIVAGTGMGCTFAPMVALAMRDVKPYMAGAASGFLNTVRQVAQALGAAVGGAILDNAFATNLTAQAHTLAVKLPIDVRARFLAGFAKIAAQPPSFGVGSGPSFARPPGIPAALWPHNPKQYFFSNPFLHAMRPAMTSAVILLVVAVLLASIMRGTRAASAFAASEAAS
jgi:EmrB/QacA subfamily drug resistance transporter